MGYHLHRLSIKRRSNLTKTIPSAQSVKKYQEAMLDYLVSEILNCYLVKQLEEGETNGGYLLLLLILK